MLEQKMADLPPDRAEIGPPSPMSASMRLHCGRYRQGGIEEERQTANAVASSAIHMERFETMDANAFICALRRFVSIRAAATRLRCDRGSNFVGEMSELDEALAEMDNKSVERSHFGRVWERQIGTITRILDAMLVETGVQKLPPRASSYVP